MTLDKAHIWEHFPEFDLSLALTIFSLPFGIDSVSI